LLSTTRIKQLKSLNQKKFRRIENKFLLEGHRLIDQALSTNTEIEEVWVTNKSRKSSIGEKLLHKIDNKNIPWSITPDKIIHQISDSLNDQGIIALSPIPIYKRYNKPPMQSIYLDGVSDPGNMGTILRTAAWFGIKSVFLSPCCVDSFNSKDPQEIVIDEVVGQMLPLLAIPIYETLYIAPKEYYCIAAFILFRLFDIWKPFPINYVDKNTEGSLGIMLDDILAGIYTIIILIIIFFFIGA